VANLAGGESWWAPGPAGDWIAEPVRALGDESFYKRCRHDDDQGPEVENKPVDGAPAVA